MLQELFQRIDSAHYFETPGAWSQPPRPNPTLDLLSSFLINHGKTGLRISLREIHRYALSVF